MSAVRSRPRAPSKSLGLPRLLLYPKNEIVLSVNAVCGKKCRIFLLKLHNFCIQRIFINGINLSSFIVVVFLRFLIVNSGIKPNIQTVLEQDVGLAVNESFIWV